MRALFGTLIFARPALATPLALRTRRCTGLAVRTPTRRPGPLAALQRWVRR